MPTGYTAGILDGEIKTFPEFAKLCMRAFGAAIHMRDDSLKEEYVPRVPSDYHVQAIAEANKLLEESERLSDLEIVAVKSSELMESKKRHLEAIERTRKNWEALVAILKEAEAYTPPTDEHTGIKDFMIQQIKETLRFDGSTKYHDEAIAGIEEQFLNMTADSVRADIKAKCEYDLQYHTKMNNEEIERCEKANKWVEDFLASLDAK